MKNVTQIPQPAELASLVEAAIPQLASTLRPDYLAALRKAQDAEKNPRARQVLDQLVKNAEMASAEHLPICQDTGYVWIALEVSGDICLPADIFSEVDAAVTRAYKAAGLRLSIVKDALIDRTNTGTNTPAFCEIITLAEDVSPSTSTEQVPNPVTPVIASEAKQSSDIAKLHIMLKGGGSDNASQLAMLPPGAGFAGIKQFVVDAVTAKGANACPPLVLGVGVGSTFDKVGGLAKHGLLRKIGTPNPRVELRELELELLQAVNATGIGPGGLGGNTTALAVHLSSAPSHIAALPVAINLGCCAMRSVTIDLPKWGRR